MIKIEGLSKSFRTEEVETIALNNVSLVVIWFLPKRSM